MKTSIRRTFTTVGAAAATAGMLALGVSAASAHVSVDPASTTEGGYSQLTFKVPNESPSAASNRVEVKLPTDTPFTSVQAKPVEGWTVQIITSDLPKPVDVSGTTVTKAATSVVWTADATHGISQNQYQTFSLSVGQLPTAGTTVLLPVAQSYTDGTVVNWDEKTAAGQAEPENPAPEFVTTAATEPASATSAAATTAAAPAQTSDNSAAGSMSVWGIVLGAAGLVLGGTALGLVLAGRRKATARTAD